MEAQLRSETSSASKEKQHISFPGTQEKKTQADINDEMQNALWSVESQRSHSLSLSLRKEQSVETNSQAWTRPTSQRSLHLLVMLSKIKKKDR